MKPQLVRGAGAERLRAGVIGCGGRGTQAVANLLSGDANVEVVAAGDLFPDRLATCLEQLNTPDYLQNNVRNVAAVTGRPVAEIAASVAKRVRVPKEKQFTGLDSYRGVLAADIDVVI
jgi:predicted dehydrogenase